MMRFFSLLFLFVSWSVLASDAPTSYTKRVSYYKNGKGYLFQTQYCAHGDQRFDQDYCVSKFYAPADSKGDTKKNFKSGAPILKDGVDKKKWFNRIFLLSPGSKRKREEFHLLKQEYYNQHFDTDGD